MRTRYVLISIIVVAAMIAGVVGLQTIHSSSDNGKPPSVAPPAPFIVAADSRGAVVFDLGRDLILGYDRSGKLVWQDQTMAKSAFITCRKSCPDAVGSGSLTDQSAEARQPMIVRAGDRSTTLPATNADLVLLERDTRTRVVMERRPEGVALASYQQGKLKQRLPLADSRMPQVISAATGDIAVVSQGRGSSTVLFVRRTDDGWNISSVPDKTARSGCVGGQVEAVVRDDGATVVNRASGREHRVQQEHVGSCHVAGDGLLAETRSVGPAGNRSLVKYWDVRSGVDWTMEGADSLSADLDPSGTYAAVVQGTVATIRGGTSSEVVEGVVDARYADDGSLVLLHPDATVSRRPSVTRREP